MPETPVAPSWSASDRPRLVRELEFTPIVQREKPATLIRSTRADRPAYFQCPVPVADTLRLFDGTRTLEQVAREASRIMADDVSAEDLKPLLAQLWGYGFLEGSAAPRGEIKRWRRWLAIPLFEFEAGPRFERFARLFAPIFRPKAGPWLALAFVILTTAFIVFFEQMWFAVGISLLHMAHWWLFAIYYAFFLVNVVFHEAGHAIAYVNYGGRRPRFGISIFLFAFVAFHTDVSDSYRFDNKWKKVGVSLAGPLVNLTLCVATMIGWLFASGDVQTLLFFFMAVNMGSVIVSLYPSVRSDIYYALAAFFETPNLYEKSVKFVAGSVRRIFHGRPSSVTPDGPGQATVFATFAVVGTLAVAGAYYGLFLQVVAASPASALFDDTFVMMAPGAASLHGNWLATRELYEQGEARELQANSCDPGGNATANTSC